MTSSPGPMPSAFSAMIKEDVPFAAARQCFAPSICAHLSSKAGVTDPPVRFHRPLKSVLRSKASSFSAIIGQDGNLVVRTGFPPSAAGLSLLAVAAAADAALTALAAINRRRSISALF